ncbi:hypothetical protein L2D08_04365 [Domibacillus sp. PGB-M46]|uniref:hypothetical protein n=1 Tax=Domibacillus sp. PGB-M46 TaxID=2910255 RepID=UPI001F5770EA|nr:hypothetical protein [Domibacillus sp. PGB-M46]MCI2253592.1 hypothetical protein [Domibacillus sp. PGB-M46]
MKFSPNKNGMFSKQQVESSSLPVFDLYEEENVGLPFDFCTHSQLQILGIQLTKEQKQQKLIGFIRVRGYRGYAGLYSFKEIRLLF